MANSLLLCRAWQNSRKSLVRRATVSCVHWDLLPDWNSHSLLWILQHIALESTGCKCQPFCQGLEGYSQDLGQITVQDNFQEMLTEYGCSCYPGSKFCQKYLGKDVWLGKKMICVKVMAKPWDAEFMWKRSRIVESAPPPLLGSVSSLGCLYVSAVLPTQLETEPSPS